MHQFIPCFAVVATVAFLTLNACRYAMTVRQCWKVCFISAIILLIAEFVLVQPLSSRLVALYWTDVPLNKHLDSIELAFTLCIWCVVAIVFCAIGTAFMRNKQFLESRTDTPPSGIDGCVEPWIVTGIIAIVISFLAILFAYTHEPIFEGQPRGFEALSLKGDAPPLGPSTYHTILVISTVGWITGLIFFIRGYYLLGKTCFKKRKKESKEICGADISLEN